MEQEMEQEIDLLELFKVLLSKIWILLICMIVGGLLAFTVSKVAMPREYESNTTMYVMNYNSAYTDQNNGSDIDLGDLNTSKTLASTYITVLKSNAVMEEIEKRMTKQIGKGKLQEVLSFSDEKDNSKRIRECFTMATVDDTEVIKITARTEDPEVSAQMCNTLGEVAPSFLQSVVKAGSVEIIDVAVPNEIPVSPKVKRNTMLGMLIGLILSAAAIILLFYIDDTVKGKEELSRRFNEPTLGEIQRIELENTQKKKKIQIQLKKKTKKKTDEKRNLLTDNSIPFNVKESYKTLRTNIFFALSTFEKRVFAVSSVNPSEGKSTTAANIAIAFAQTGSKVLLIDADMRKPVQNKTFRIKNTKGLSSLIAKTSGINDSIRATSIERLDLLPSGPIPPNPSELLASERFKSILRQLENQYDYIILDTPPISVVTDAMVMKDAIAGILLVLRYGSTKEQDIAECLKRFEFSEANMLGFVLNDIQRKGGVGYYRSKKYGYGYGNNYGYDYGYSKSGAQMDEYIPDAEETTESGLKNTETAKNEQLIQSEDTQDDRLSLSHTAADRRRIEERGDVSGNDPAHEEAGSAEDRSDAAFLRPQREKYRSFS